MVSFICDACGHTVKKNRVEKHYQSECPNCSVLSCIDCGKDFHGDAYATHTSCITEAEKYQGKLYKPKENANKGDLKQQEWIKSVQEAGDSVANPKLKGYLNRIQEYSNVPRKKAKFINFCKNSLKLHDLKVLEQLWDAFNPKKDKEVKVEQSKDGSSLVVNGNSSKIEEHDEAKKNDKLNGKRQIKKESKKRKKEAEKMSENGIENIQNNEGNNEGPKKKKKRKDEHDQAVEEEEVDSVTDGSTVVGKFNWQKAIKTILKDAGEDGLTLKKVQKKVISAYHNHGKNHQALTSDECRALFKRKLEGYKKARIVKERVFFRKK